ncbi:unnamed protein product [Urochloa decumbens]|uniref:Uncharacterized protein n=1 Tax=Urochloa decumbens TaxID=240449 RepID=A0ABC8Z8K5_9POAL
MGIPTRQLAQARAAAQDEGIMWTLWKTRNDLVFNDKIVSSPMAVAYKLVAYLSNWKLMLEDEDRQKMTNMISNLARMCETS